jgi:putative phage-type endonuclease
MDKRVINLLKIPKIEQKSKEWYEARHSCITASDLAQALGEGKFGTAKDLLIKKVNPPESGQISNPFFQWGNMFEQVACDIYSAMNKVKVFEFGLLKHPTVDYFAASPDGISENAIMLEIKCPLRRKFNFGDNVPTQYYYQIQGQLDVCDLDECDYFECAFNLYQDVDDFIECKETKGVFAKVNNKYIYGPLVLKSDIQDLSDINEFILNNTNIQYWSLINYNLKRVQRDKKFINEKLKELKEVWDKILFYRENLDVFRSEIVQEYSIETEPCNLVKIPKFAFLDDS